MPGEVVSLEARRSGPRPKSARFEATPAGDVALTVVLEDGEVVDVTMSRDQAARLILQGTDAVEVAEGISRG